MARSRVVVEGDDELRRKLEKIVDGLDDLREVGGDAARLIAERAEDQAPEASGRLKNDIRTFATKRNAGMRIGRKRIPYAGPIIGGYGSPAAPRRQGGFNAPPNPFIYDALDERREAITASYGRFIDALVAGEPVRSRGKYRRHTEE